VNAGPIPDLLSVVLLAWLAGLALAFIYALFNGEIQMNGLFATDVDNDGIADEFHPERVQMLLISAVGIASYAFMAMDAALASKAALIVLPDVPEELVMLLGASNSMYLTGKFGRTLKRG
jgi:hypothetical protein